MQKGKTVVVGSLAIVEKRREEKGKGEKERYIHLNWEFQRTARKIIKQTNKNLAKWSMQRNSGKQQNDKD